VINRAQQVLRQALVLEMARRAMAEREPAEPNNSEGDQQAGASNPPAVNEAQAGSDGAAHPLSEKS
jgi:hypothetical protein